MCMPDSWGSGTAKHKKKFAQRNAELLELLEDKRFTN